MIQTIRAFILCDDYTEIEQIPAGKDVRLVFCRETRRWYQRNDFGVWESTDLMLPVWDDVIGKPE